MEPRAIKPGDLLEDRNLDVIFRVVSVTPDAWPPGAAVKMRAVFVQRRRDGTTRPELEAKLMLAGGFEGELGTVSAMGACSEERLAQLLEHAPGGFATGDAR